MGQKKAVSAIVCLLLLLLSSCAAKEADAPFSPSFLSWIGGSRQALGEEYTFENEESSYLLETAEICGQEWRICFGFDRGQKDRIGNYAYELEAEDLSQEEIYGLLEQLLGLIEQAYGEADTAPFAGVLSEIPSADMLPQPMGWERWIVPGEWEYPGELEESMRKDMYLQLELRYTAAGEDAAAKITLSYEFVYHPLSMYEQEPGIIAL